MPSLSHGGCRLLKGSSQGPPGAGGLLVGLLAAWAAGCSEPPPSARPGTETAGAPPASPRAAGAPAFVDISAEAGVEFSYFNGMSGELYMPEMMGAGGAVFDFDGDGDLDLYLVEGGMLGPGKPLEAALLRPRGGLPLSDRLYRNDLVAGEGETLVPRFVEVTAASRLRAVAARRPSGAAGYGMGVAAADYDGDGFVDLYLTELGPNRLLRNRGDGTFDDVTAAAGVADPRWSLSASFLDFDRDGRPDLFVANYLDFRFETTKLCFSPSGRRDYCGPTAYEPVANSLFRNRGDGTFEDLSERSGIRGFAGASMGVATADFDGDGRVDLYVANDQMQNELWLNGGDGTFHNEALLAGVAVNADGEADASMGVDAGDCDGDGDEDLFITNLIGETNTLYLQVAPGDFRDETRARGLGMPSWTYTGFGTAFLDYDLDGWLDLFTVNGLVEIPDAREEEGALFPLDQPNQLFRNLGECTFEETTAAAGPAFLVSEVSRGAAVGDLDNDGAPDLAVFNNAAPTRLLRNTGAVDANRLGLRLLLAGGGSEVLGARALVRLAGEAPRMRRVRSDGSYASAQDPRLLFGLGRRQGPLEVEVTWPDGGRSRWRGVPAGGYVTLVRHRERRRT